MKARFLSLCAAGLFCAPFAASHAALVGQSASPVGPLRYVGLGDTGGGVGSGRYTLGDCVFAANVTTCTVSGSYVESAQSTHTPGQGGTFTMVLTYSGNGPSPVIARSETAGSSVLRFSSLGDAVFTLRLRPTAGGEIVGTYPAPVFADSIGFNAFLSGPTASCTGIGASQCTIGNVGLTPNAAIAGGLSTFSFNFPETFVAADGNYQGLWWNSPANSESGWGINFAHQADTIFATWFTYDLAGKAWWLSMTATSTNQRVFSGTIVQGSGPPFNAVPFNPAQVTQTPVGNGTLSFSSATSGTFTYTVNGVTQTKAIVTTVFASPPICAWNTQADLTQATNYQDIWWAAPAGVESGWGINFSHQSSTIFATWFTYDVDRKPLWYSVTAPQTAPRTFTGTLQRSTGPAFSAVPFNPDTVQRVAVGTATVTFEDGNNATFAYQVKDGLNVASQTKAITRTVFRAPGTICRP